MNELLKALEDLAYIKEQLPFYDDMGSELVIDESDFKTTEKALKVLEIIKMNSISSLKLEWDGEWWTIRTPLCPHPICYGRKKEDYELLKEMFEVKE